MGQGGERKRWGDEGDRGEKETETRRTEKKKLKKVKLTTRTTLPNPYSYCKVKFMLFGLFLRLNSKHEIMFRTDAPSMYRN